MDDLEALSDEELSAKSKAWRREAYALILKAYRCEQIINARDAAVALATAEAAIQRAKNGTCTKGMGDCPVHQMGSCKKQ